MSEQAIKSPLSRIKAVLFDLDGTISDNSAGITGCIEYALTEMGLPAPAKEQLYWCIGPPLRSTFSTLLALNPEDLKSSTAEDLVKLSAVLPPASTELVESAIRLYRLRYGEWGWHQNILYPDIPALFSKLCTSGRTLAVTTTKTKVFAERIIGHFGLAGQLAAVYGPDAAGRQSSKTELVNAALQDHGFEPETTAIVGDRDLDILGGKSHNLTTVGVSYGFGSINELQAAGADYIVSSVIELINLFE